MKKLVFFVILFGIVCFSGFSQTNVTAKLVEFRIRESTYTREMDSDVQVNTYVSAGVKYLNIVLTPLSNSVVFTGDTFGWNLYNDSDSGVSWRTSVGGNYIQISNFVFIEATNNGKKLYLIQEGINEGLYNTNVLIILLPNSFNL
jgi:hypothetical protein